MLQEGVMSYRTNRLPNRFPVGTKFVIEGKRSGKGQVQVYSRYLEFPDGTFLRLPNRPAGPVPAAGRRRRHSRTRVH